MSAGVPAGGKPRIGVVIPTFNCRHVIMGAIDSLRAQTYPNVHIIIADDGSTDDTESLLAPLATGDDFTYIKIPNRGVSAARNTGIRATDDPLVAFLDADDTLEPDALRSLAAALENDAGASFASADVLRVYPEHSELRVGAPSPGDPLQAILERNYVEGGGLFRRPALVEAGLFDESMRACEDWDLYIRLIERGFLSTYVPGASYRYVMRGDSITRNELALVRSFEHLIRKHHAPRARTGHPVFRRLYAHHLWKIARMYFYVLHMRGKALSCVLEALVNDPVPQRLKRHQLVAPQPPRSA